MNNNQNYRSSLLEIIREQKKKKNRPLKVIVDIDECLQPVKPLVIYELLEEPKPEFKEFFKEFWKNAETGASSTSNKIIAYHGSDEVKRAIEKQKELLQEVRSNPELAKKNNNFYASDRRFNAPLLTTADGLVEGYKEGHIGELFVISSTISGKDIEGKKSKVKRTLGKFPNVTVEVTRVKKGSDGRFNPHRWEVVRDKFPDFDVFVEDNHSLVTGSPTTLKLQKQIPGIENKTFVLTDYRDNFKAKGPNIYHFKTALSDLKDEDFIKVAEELKAKKKQERKDWVEKVMKKSIWKQPNTYLFLLSGVSLTLLVVFLIMAVRKKRK